MRLSLLWMLLLSSPCWASKIQFGSYLDYPFGNGVTAKMEVANSPLQVRFKWGVLTPGFLQAGTQFLMNTDKMTLQEAIVIDNAYEEGFQYEMAVGMKFPGSDQFYFDFGYGLMKGDGTMSDEDSNSVMGNTPNDIMPLVQGPNKQSLRMGLKGDIHFLQTTLGMQAPLNDSFTFRAELALRRPIASEMKVEFGPNKIKDEFSERVDQTQKDLLHDLAVIPSFTFGINYTFKTEEIISSLQEKPKLGSL